MTYKCRHFEIYELVDIATYKNEREKAWRFIPRYVKKGLDDFWEFLEEKLGKKPVVIINDYEWGGGYNWSGLRFGPAFDKENKDNPGKYASRSFHKLGQAFDCKIKDHTAEEIRKLILDNENDYRLQDISRLERDVSWVHLEFSDMPERIILFKG